MLQPAPRPWLLACLLALLCLFVLVGCQSTNQGSQNPGATKTAQKTSTVKSGTPTPGGPPSATATPITACNGQLADVVVPDGATLVGQVTTKGATITCAYIVKEDLKTVGDFFKTKMGSKGWTFLSESPEGPLAMVQTYFKNQSFATITLSQHQQDAHTTDFTISVENSK